MQEQGDRTQTIPNVRMRVMPIVNSLYRLSMIITQTAMMPISTIFVWPFEHKYG